MLVIGLGHKARHGKDYLAKQLILDYARLRGIQAKQYAFADALKSYCRVAFGMREKDAPLLQYMGTNVFRKYDPEIWVRVLEDTIVEQQPQVAILTDCRFPNEAGMVTRLGGVMVKVSRLMANGEPWVAQDRDPTHPSEIALDNYPFDYAIKVPDGRLDELESAGRQLLNCL